MCIFILRTSRAIHQINQLKKSILTYSRTKFKFFKTISINASNKHRSNTTNSLLTLRDRIYYFIANLNSKYLYTIRMNKSFKYRPSDSNSNSIPDPAESEKRNELSANNSRWKSEPSEENNLESIGDERDLVRRWCYRYDGTSRRQWMADEMLNAHKCMYALEIMQENNSGTQPTNGNRSVNHGLQTRETEDFFYGHDINCSRLILIEKISYCVPLFIGNDFVCKCRKFRTARKISK